MDERPRDQTARVRAGYNIVSRAYRGDTPDEATQRQYAEWLGDVRDRAPAGSDLLDLGCGNGIPAAKWLSDNGFRVTGVDLSDTMVERARELVPAATFLRGDVTSVDKVDFDAASFDAVVSFYTLIHLPLTDRPNMGLRRCDPAKAVSPPDVGRRDYLFGVVTGQDHHTRVVREQPAHH